jgi:hypothetical protein
MEFIGVFIAAISIAVAPVHIFIAFTSKIFEDRQFIRTALILTVFGCFLLIDYENMSEVQYIFGTILMYLGMNMDDGVTASLLSKIIPPHFSVGIFNVGLIVTFAGSLARGIGGFSIAVAGWIESNSEWMENIIFIPMAGLAAAGTGVVFLYYKVLTPSNEKKSA